MTTSPAATFEGVLPSRLTAADRGQIERRVQEIGRGLLERALAAEPTAASSEWWVQQAAEWATQDDDLKVRLFRLVDCMPMLDDPAALDRLYRVSGIGSKAGGADYLLQFTVPRTVTENTLRAHPTVRRRSAARMRGGQGRAAVDRAGFLADSGEWRWRRRSARIAWPQERS
jgi:hypothetical protein